MIPNDFLFYSKAKIDSINMINFYFVFLELTESFVLFEFCSVL